LARLNFKAFWDWEELSSRPWRSKRENQRLRTLQVNLHHSRAASAALCVALKICDVALIYRNLGPIKGKLKD
jgi:hypothetical protein